MDKRYILEEIRRTAAGNGGKPLGRLRLEREAGIKEYHWTKYWPRFGDAVREAGFQPNERTGPIGRELLLRQLVGLARELRRFPTMRDLRVKRTTDPSFPNEKTFSDRLGDKSAIMKAAAQFCAANDEYADVLQWCAAEDPPPAAYEDAIASRTSRDGFVYLLKSGRYYKIGRTNAFGRREYEIGLQLPDAATTVHTIKTDDPVGIEAYWHKRFEDRRKNGEWFELTRQDVAAFRRRKFM